MIKITKFGGSSVANAQQFAKVKNIIESDPARRFVVVSAVGRANKQDNKVTDLLYLCQAHMQDVYKRQDHKICCRIEQPQIITKKYFMKTGPEAGKIRTDPDSDQSQKQEKQTGIG